MLLKWIRCTVPPASRPAFARAQAEWGAIRGTPGFHGQVGGWSAESPDEASILGLWESASRYEDYMSAVHDRVLDASNQAATYDEIAVDLAEELFPMPGEQDSLPEAVSSAGFLRATRCRVGPVHRDAFVDMQRKVWLPGMRAAAGMLGGTFGVTGDVHPTYVIATLWTGERAHAEYVRDRLPRLREASGAQAMLTEIMGVRARIEERWRVLGR